MEMSAQPGRLHVPLTVHDALRRGRGTEAVKCLREANPGLSAEAARRAVRRLGQGVPANRLGDAAQPQPGALPDQAAPLPSEVAARLATGNKRDAARCLREKQPGLDEDEALEAVERHASPLLLREAREDTVAVGDSGRFGWVLWTLALLAAGAALALLW